MQNSISKETNLLRASFIRISKDLTHRAFWGSVLSALVFSFLFFRTQGVNFEIKDITSLVISYSSISFSACLTALVLSLTIPGNDRIGRWASHENDKIESNAYLDLVIGIAFSALAQIILLGHTLLFSIIQGPQPLSETPKAPNDYIFILSLSFLVFYSFTRIYVVLETVWQVAQLISEEEKIFYKNGSKK